MTGDSLIRKLNERMSYVRHIPANSVSAARKNGFRASTDMSEIRKADAILICVPTPLTRHREPDLRFVIGTSEAILPHLREGQVVSFESTTFHGTTEEERKARIESRRLKVGKDVFLVFSPEREDSGNPHYTTKTTPKICSGSTPAWLEVAKALYGQIVDRPIPVSSTRAAELTKLLENVHRAMNIRLVNEMKIIADKMGIDTRGVYGEPAANVVNA